MEQAALPAQYTVGEYLTLEESSEVRHEFYQGEIFAMAGATLVHNRIIGNSYRALGDRLDASRCEAFLDGALLKIDNSCFVYPDLLVSCHPDDLAADRILQQPSVILEVLSPATAAYDRTTKLRFYQRLTSMQHYVLVQQEYCWVECLTRQPEQQNQWTLQVYDALSDELHLPALQLRVPLAELYARVKLGPPPQLPTA